MLRLRTPEQLGDNLAASDLKLADDDLRELNTVSDPGTPYPKGMVLQLVQAEDPRPRVLRPEFYTAEKAPWQDLRYRQKG